MRKKLEKYRAERERNNAKIAELKEENRELDRLITELENTEIIGLVRAENMRPEEKQLRRDGIAAGRLWQW